MFRTLNPIVVSGMLGVSDLKLAKASYDADCVPSLITGNYKNIKELAYDLDEYSKYSNNSEVVLSITIDYLKNSSLVRLVDYFKIRYIELLNNFERSEILESLSEKTTILQKTITFPTSEFYETNKDIISGIVIKSDVAASRIGIPNLDNTLRLERKSYPEWVFIASGGINNHSDIKNYLSAGCSAVSIGTLFALSKESLLSEEVKLKLIKSSYSDVQALSNNRGGKQNMITFSEVKDIDSNFTSHLLSGIRNTNEGAVFMGKSIDTVTEILSVRQIVERLTHD